MHIHIFARFCEMTITDPVGVRMRVCGVEHIRSNAFGAHGPPYVHVCESVCACVKRVQFD